MASVKFMVGDSVFPSSVSLFDRGEWLSVSPKVTSGFLFFDEMIFFPVMAVFTVIFHVAKAKCHVHIIYIVLCQFLFVMYDISLPLLTRLAKTTVNAYALLNICSPCSLPRLAVIKALCKFFCHTASSLT